MGHTIVMKLYKYRGNSCQPQRSSYVGFIVLHVLVHAQNHHHDGSMCEPERVAQ